MPDIPPPVPPEIVEHAECASVLVQTMADRGCEVTASDWRPGMVMPSGIEPLNMRCPHGVLMWMEPTGEQRMKWGADR